MLRCWVREHDLAAPADGTLRIPLRASGTALLAPVHYWSPTGWHRFGPPRLAGAPGWAPPADAVTVAALLAREPTPTHPATAQGADPAPDPDRAPDPALDAVPVPAPDPALDPVPAPVSAPAPALDAVPVPAPVPALDPVSAGAPVPAPVSAPGSMPGATPGPIAGAAADSGADRVPGLAPGAPWGPVVDPAPGSAPGRPSGLPQGSPSATPPSPHDATSSRASDPAPGFASCHLGDLVSRVADSVRRTEAFIADRRGHPVDGSDLFLSAEQALLLGHPLHPTAKSREGLSDAEARRYSPELRGCFPLHWLAVAPSVLAADSAWTERGVPVPAGRLTERLAGPDLPLPDGFRALPLHPWQAREIRHRPEVVALLDAGLLRDLGPYGEPWHPTSSVRTVHRSGAPAMLKLSLGLRITNSRRENLRKELHRGVEVHRLLRGGVGKQWRSAHPRFDIVRDPAWLAVDDQDGIPVTGLDVVIRHNPFAPTVDASCVAGLVSPRPRAALAGQRRPVLRSRLAEIVTRLAVRTGRSRAAVTTEWFLRYLEQVVRPVLWLDSEAGVALEAHQQNTVLLLDPDGWPTGGRYRDNQGYYFRESRRGELDARLPGIGAHSDTFVPDEVTDERFAYYLGINNVLGLIGAFGSQRLADERLLLAAFRHFLARVATGPDRLRTPLPAHLLDSPVLRCKANLLTRLHGLDELVGPVDSQSVYVTIANPLHS
nr:IucA/IucC family protein [Streptomyces sp. TP-A0356]